MTLAARTARNTALVAGSRLLSRVLALYVFLLQGRSMGAGNLGRFSLLVVFSALTAVVVDIGLRPLFIRETARDRTRLTPYLNSILSLKLVMALPAALVLGLAISLQRELRPDLWVVLPATMAVLLGASFSNQLRAIFYSTGRLGHEAISTILESVVLLSLTVVAALTHQPYWVYLWAYACAYGFTIVYVAVLAVSRFGHRFAFDLNLRRLFGLGRESYPFALSFIISTLYYKIDQPILGFVRSVREVGLYNGAYKFLDAATFIPQALMDPVFPALSVLAGGDAERLPGAATKAYKMLAAVAMPVTVGFVVLAGPIIRLGLGNGFESAVPILRVLALSIIFLFINNTFIYTLNAMGRQIESTRLALLSLVVNVGLNVALIPLYGAMGAAVATGLTEVALFAGGYALLRRHLFALPVLGALRGVLPAGIVCGAVMAVIVGRLPGTVPVYLLSVVAGGVAYAGALLATHAFTAEELAIGRQATRLLARRR